MTLYTIGFTKKPASAFFSLLRECGARRLVDVRLNPGGQLSGFAKESDLAYFLHELCGMDYLHMPELAPTREMLDGLRKGHRHWPTYEREFLALMEQRRVEETVASGDARRRRAAVQRGHAGAVPSAAGGGAPAAALGRRGGGAFGVG